MIKEKELIGELYYPTPEVIANAHVPSYEEINEAASKNLSAFWGRIAAENFEWYSPWQQVVDESDAPFYKWFAGAKVNLVHNALDRHVRTAMRNKAALIFEGEPGDSRVYTYQQLNYEVGQFASILRSFDIGKGSHVAILLGRIPELIITVLACAKVGAVVAVMGCDWQVGQINGRLAAHQPQLLITADGTWHNGQAIPLKRLADSAMAGIDRSQTVICIRRTGQAVSMLPQHDHWYHDLMTTASPDTPTEFMDADDPLIIYYAGETADAICHSYGGYMVGIASTLRWVFDIRPEDVYWCTTDPATITGHSYLLYAPFLLGTTTFLYEGSLTHRHPDRWPQMMNRYGISLLYSDATTVANLRQVAQPHCPQLRLIGSSTVLSLDDWHWLYNVLGQENCPILTTWQQPETGSITLSSLPSMPLKPGSVGMGLPGLGAAVVDQNGDPLLPNQPGHLIFKTPWPAMLRTLINNPGKYIEQYWQTFAEQGWYATGQQARQDEDGYFWLL